MAPPTGILIDIFQALEDISETQVVLTVVSGQSEH